MGYIFCNFDKNIQRQVPVRSPDQPKLISFNILRRKHARIQKSFLEGGPRDDCEPTFISFGFPGVSGPPVPPLFLLGSVHEGFF